MAAIIIWCLAALFIFFDTIIEWLLKVLNPFFKRMEEKDRIEALGEHRGMYHYFLSEEDKSISKP
jgi:hypothetical protein